MTTTHAFDPELDRLERDLLLLLFAQRETLPHAANGQPMAPSSPYVADVLRDLKAEKKRSVRHVLAILLCNLDDGVEAEYVELFVQRLAAIVRARRMAKPTRPVLVESRCEQRADHALDMAQLQVAERENDPQALEALSHAAAQEAAAANRLREAAEQRLVVLRGGERQPRTSSRPFPSPIGGRRPLSIA